MKPWERSKSKIHTQPVCIILPFTRPRTMVSAYRFIIRFLSQFHHLTSHSPADYHPKTWTEHWGADARKAQRELSSDLNAFLDGAHIIPNYEWNFHYYASDIMYPYYGEHMDYYGMWASIDQSCGYEIQWAEVYDGIQDTLKERKLGRYVRLYWATNIASHQEGLM